MFPQSSKNGPMSPMWQQPCPIHGVEVVPQESPTLGCLNLLSRRCRLLMLSSMLVIWRSTDATRTPSLQAPICMCLIALCILQGLAAIGCMGPLLRVLSMIRIDNGLHLLDICCCPCRGMQRDFDAHTTCGGEWRIAQEACNRIR